VTALCNVFCVSQIVGCASGMVYVICVAWPFFFFFFFFCVCTWFALFYCLVCFFRDCEKLALCLCGCRVGKVAHAKSCVAKRAKTRLGFRVGFFFSLRGLLTV
jgi:hypothetical protein